MTDERIRRAGNAYLEQMAQLRRTYTHGEWFEPAVPKFDIGSSTVKPLAYYLPQFHPIAENDRWWGRGFTEWTNVTRARPHYPGHYQPHLPADLGFYDLRTKETLPSQVDLARSYGIHGFIYHYYWFNGHRLLERPLDDMLKRPEIDFPFALCWANENWTRRWDGAESEVLLGQKHSLESDERFIRDAFEYLRDDRYIRIDGKPLLIVYRVGLLPHIVATTEKWREIARRELGTDLFLAYATTFGESRDPSSIGFDAAIQFPPHMVSVTNISNTVEPYSPDYAGQVFNYEELAVDARKRLEAIEFPIIPGVFPSWDNTARRGEEANSFQGSNPDTYGNWVSEAVAYANANPIEGESFIVINAWNEWAEGAHLEPDQRNGHAYLRTTADVLRPYVARIDSFGDPTGPAYGATASLAAESKVARGRTAIVVHAYYADRLSTILEKIPADRLADTYVTVATDTDPLVLSALSKVRGKCNILFLPNRGRDVRPFLSALNDVWQRGYEYVLKLHTKKTVHRSDGDAWAEELIDPLISSLTNGALEKYFDDHPLSGMIAPKGHILDANAFMGSAGNVAWLKMILRALGLPYEKQDFSFVAGSMFGARLSVLSPLLNQPLLMDMFEEEMGRRDGTMAHAMERLFGLLAAIDNKAISETFLSNNRCSFRAGEVVHSDYTYAARQSWK